MTSVKPVDHTLIKMTGRTSGVVHHALDIVVSADVSNAIYIAVYGAAHVAADEILDEVFNAVSDILRGTIGPFDDSMRSTIRREAIQPT